VETSAGGRLYYEVAGAGPAVVLIHAGLWDARIWDDQFEVFAEHHRVVRYDIRGFGRSDHMERPFSFQQDMADLMAALDLSHAALVGGSLGGAIAMDVAIDRPDLVDALVLVCSGLGGYEWGTDEGLKAAWPEIDRRVEQGDLEGAVDLSLSIWTPLRTDPEVDRRIREIAMDQKRNDLENWDLVQGLDPPAAERLDEVRVPTLVIVGDRDVRDMETVADRLIAGIPTARRVTMTDCDHLPNMRDPVGFNRLVLDFLRGTTSE
jgi:3-oxoadipate enol-lactonase